MNKYILCMTVFLAFWCCSDIIAGQSQKVPDDTNSFERQLKRDKKLSGPYLQKQKEIVDWLPLNNGDAAADIGAGTGNFTILLSKKVGAKGKVYAVDIDQRMLDHIAVRAKKDALHNIEYILTKPDDPSLPKDSQDLIFISNTYALLPDREIYLKILNTALKKNGRLAIVNVRMIKRNRGDVPPGIVIPKEQILDEVLKAGFKLEAEFFFITNQYFFVFVKDEERI